MLCRIETAKPPKDIILGTFLDIDGAFEKVQLSVIKTAFQSLDVGSSACFMTGIFDLNWATATHA